MVRMKDQENMQVTTKQRGGQKNPFIRSHIKSSFYMRKSVKIKYYLKSELKERFLFLLKMYSSL